MHSGFKDSFFVIIIFCLTGLTHAGLTFPGERSSWYTYSDAADGGNSESYGFSIDDSCITWPFQIKKNNNHRWPFIGLSKILTTQEKRSIHPGDTLIADLRCSRKLQIVMKLSTTDPEVTRPGDIKSCRVLEYPVSVGPQNCRIALPLASFCVAQWWKRLYAIPAEDNRLFLDSVCRIGVTVNNPHIGGQTDTIIICNLDVHHKNNSTSAWIFTGIIACIIIIMLCIRMTISRRKAMRTEQTKKSPSANADLQMLKPRQITANPSDWDRIIDYLQTHYTEPQLGIPDIAATLGFSESKLSRIINAKHTGGFRCLIHELRINEGKRLLEDSEMNVSEIAYKLGYATPNHFNREFRKRTGMTPGAFRKK